jgi:hypothetical protein
MLLHSNVVLTALMIASSALYSEPSHASDKVRLVRIQDAGTFESQSHCQKALQLLASLSTDQAQISGSCFEPVAGVFQAHLNFAVQVPSDYTCGALLFQLRQPPMFDPYDCAQAASLLGQFSFVRNRVLMISAACRRSSRGDTSIDPKLALTPDERCRLP